MDEKKNYIDPFGLGDLIGFDVREDWLDYHATWGIERREKYLIRHDLRKPLSVDPSVWQALCGQAIPFNKYCDLPDWIGLNRPLWDSLIQLEKWVRQKTDIESNPVRLIAVTRAYGAQSPHAREWPYLTLTDPPKVEPKWRYLGLDIVANQSLLSGLMNCGYTAVDLAEASGRWKHHLNEFHLFDSLHPAIEFAHWNDIRVPEHSPFEAWAIYDISSSSY